MDLISLTIDGVQVEVAPGTTVLEAARQAGIRIPTLCYLKDINEIGACRMCVVDTGARALQAACVLPVAPNMKVKTNTPAVRAARKMNLELLLSNHDRKCLSCVRSTTCELQAMCLEYGVDNEDAFAGSRTDYKVDDSSPSLIRDPGKCILCRRCIAVCDKVQNVGAIGMVHRGFNSVIQPAWNHPLGSSPCINCGQCINVCPTGALTEKDDTAKVWDAINDPTKFVVVQPAPAVRAALGEEFGMPMGTSVTGKMATALHRLGFDKVFDTDFGADLTIMEESLRAGRPRKERRRTADDHVLFAGLDQVLRGILPRVLAQPVQLQVPARDGGRGHKELLRREERHRSQGHRNRVRNALRR